MRLIDRYLFRQLLGPTLLATAALSGVAILSQSLSALDILVDQRQSALIFAKITLLALPQLLVMILPVAILVAALVALNRLQTEQEIVVCSSAGMSRWRVISPAIRLSLLCGLASLFLALWIQPLCFRLLRQTLDDVRADLAATMVKPGRFTHPAPGLTVYAKSVDEDGEIHNLFIDYDNGRGRDATITAREGRLVRRNGVPVLVMRHGANQEFSTAGVLNFLSFDEYPFDLRQLMALDRPVHYKLSDRYLHELLFPDTSQEWERHNLFKLRAEAHSRLSAPFYDVAFMALALAALIGGPFSRPGYAARIATAAGAALVIRTLGFGVQAAAGSAPMFNLLQYLVPLAAMAGSAAIIFGRQPVWPRLARARPALVTAGQPA